MPIANLSLFISITFVVSASPGPVMLSCMNNGARLGIRQTWVGMLGASLGNIFLVILSAMGLGLIVNQNDLLFNFIKWTGAAYLVYLGIETIRKPLSLHLQVTETSHTRARTVGINGFLIAISNPKGLIYFGALFPQFIDYQQPLATQFFILTSVFLVTDLVWMLAYALAGNNIMHWLKKPVHQKWFNSLSGLLLMAAGLFMALSGKL